MAWIYLAELEDFQKLLKVTSLPPPIVKVIDIANLSSCPECGLMTCRQLPSGMTCEPCEGFIYRKSKLSTEVSPARTFPWQAAEQAWQESEADFSSRSLGLSARYDPASSSWRTSQQLLFEERTELLASFAAYGMTVDGAFYPLKIWERTTDGNGGGYWPTPCLPSNGGSHGKAKLKTMMFPTPRAEERGQYQRDRGIKGKKRPTLTGIVKMWPTPNTQGWRSDGELALRAKQVRDHAEFLRLSHRASRSKRQKAWPTPTARDCFSRSRKAEAKRHTPALNHVATNGNGGKLSPRWVEWLMGYQIGWTALEDWAMRWFRSKHGKRLKG